MGEGAFQRQLVLDQLESFVLVPDPLRGRRFLLVAADGPVEGERTAIVIGLEHLEHLGGVDAELLGDLADRGGALELDGQGRDRLVHLGHAIVQAARHAHRPDAVAEVALELAEDRRRGKGGEGSSAVGFETVDRVDEAEARNLEEVVERLAGAAVTQRQVLREGEVAAHQLLAGGLVAVLGKARPEKPVVRQPVARSGGGVALDALGLFFFRCHRCHAPGSLHRRRPEGVVESRAAPAGRIGRRAHTIARGLVALGPISIMPSSLRKRRYSIKSSAKPQPDESAVAPPGISSGAVSAFASYSSAVAAGFGSVVTSVAVSDFGSGDLKWRM